MEIDRTANGVLTYVALVSLALLGAATMSVSLLRGTVPPSSTNASSAGQASVQPAGGATTVTGGSLPVQSAGARVTVGARAPVTLRARGVPLEYFGLAWFLIALSLELLSGPVASETRLRHRLYLFALSVVGLAAVVAVAYQSMGRPHSFGWTRWIAATCIVCIFGVSALSRHASLSAVGRHGLSDARRAVGRAPTWAACAVFLAVIALRPGQQVEGSGTPTGPAFEAWFAAQPRVPIPMSAGGAAVLIVQFQDYQCGPCRKAHEDYGPVIRNLSAHYPGAIRFVTMDFPLERECNRFTSVDIHPGACEAAVAVRLAEARGRREPLERWLWENQGAMSRDRITSAARELAGVTDLDSRYEEVLGLVRADVEAGKALAIKGTPAVFVNGVRLRPVPSEDLETAILHELKAAGRTPVAQAR